LSRALLFVLGTAVAMTALGIAAALAGESMSGLGGWVAYLMAVVPIVMGLQLLGVVRLPMPKAFRSWGGRSLASAFFTGLVFSLVMSPCGTPALAAILAVAAFKGSVVFGALLLFAYGIGNGLPFLVVGTVAGEATKRLQRLGGAQWVNRGAGVAMLILGGYLVLFAARGGG
jgi:cytochrome c-type biogenesis protein